MSTDTYWSPSEVVAGQINRLRKRAGLNREQLAEACRALGGPENLTAAAVANIETGRRDQHGRRRREVSAEEVILFARALGVPPLRLLYPPEVTAEIEVLPGVVRSTWDAARWFSGEGPLDGEPEDPAHEAAVAPLRLHREHDRLVAELSKLPRSNVAIADSEELLPGLMEANRRRRQEATTGLRWVRTSMRQIGVTPPPLPPALDDLEATS